MATSENYLCLLFTCLCTLSISYGLPRGKRLLFDLFGQSISNPANMAHQLGLHNNNVGDQTYNLDAQHQMLSAGATGTGYVQHQGHHNGPAFLNQNGTSGGGPGNLPGKCSTVTSHCSPDCSIVDTVTGCIICNSNCHSGGTPIMTSQPMAKTTTAPSSGSSCPVFPSGCPRGSVKLVNGCPVCTAGSSTIIQTTVNPSPTTPRTSTIPSTAPLGTTVSPTCPPLRCVAPCNKGLTIDVSGCPKCVC